jgi:hypothetical protein
VATAKKAKQRQAPHVGQQPVEHDAAAGAAAAAALAAFAADDAPHAQMVAGRSQQVGPAQPRLGAKHEPFLFG